MEKIQQELMSWIDGASLYYCPTHIYEPRKIFKDGEK